MPTITDRQTTVQDMISDVLKNMELKPKDLNSPRLLKPHLFKPPLSPEKTQARNGRQIVYRNQGVQAEETPSETNE